MDTIDFSFRDALRLIFYLSSTLNSSDRELAGFSKKFHESSGISYREILIRGFLWRSNVHLLLFPSVDGTHKYTYSSYRHAWYDWKVSHGGGGGEISWLRIEFRIYSWRQVANALSWTRTCRPRGKQFSATLKSQFSACRPHKCVSLRHVINTARHLQRGKKPPSVSSSPVEWIPPLHVLSRNARLRMHFLVDI